MTLTLVRHKGELKPFGRLLAMRMLLAKQLIDPLKLHGKHGLIYCETCKAYHTSGWHSVA